MKKAPASVQNGSCPNASLCCPSEVVRLLAPQRDPLPPHSRHCQTPYFVVRVSTHMAALASLDERYKACKNAPASTLRTLFFSAKTDKKNCLGGVLGCIPLLLTPSTSDFLYIRAGFCRFSNERTRKRSCFGRPSPPRRCWSLTSLRRTYQALSALRNGLTRYGGGEEAQEELVSSRVGARGESGSKPSSLRV